MTLLLGFSVVHKHGSFISRAIVRDFPGELPATEADVIAWEQALQKDYPDLPLVTVRIFSIQELA